MRSSSQTFQLSCLFDVLCLVTTTSPSYQEIPDLWLLWLVWMDVSNTHVRDSSDWRGIQNYYFWERKSKRSSKFLLQMKKRLFVFAAGSTLVRFYAGEQHLEARRPWPTLNTQHFFWWKISTFKERQIPRKSVIRGSNLVSKQLRMKEGLPCPGQVLGVGLDRYQGRKVNLHF